MGLIGFFPSRKLGRYLAPPRQCKNQPRRPDNRGYLRIFEIVEKKYPYQFTNTKEHG
jgi:hypothetical protein